MACVRSRLCVPLCLLCVHIHCVQQRSDAIEKLCEAWKASAEQNSFPGRLEEQVIRGGGKQQMFLNEDEKKNHPLYAPTAAYMRRGLERALGKEKAGRYVMTGLSYLYTRVIRVIRVI